MNYLSIEEKCKKYNILNEKTYKEEVYKKTNGEYEVLSEYKGSHKKIKLKHLKCNKIYETRANSPLLGIKCPYCNPKRKLTHKDYKKKFDKKYNGEFEIVSEYKGSQNDITIRHNICNKEMKYKAYYLLLKNVYCKCPHCREYYKNNFTW